MTKTAPVTDSIKKVNDEFAVGADVEFQKSWQKFERGTRLVLTIFIVLSLAGVFGRGPLAQAHLQASDGSMRVDYERVQRFGTPSVMTINFGADSIHDGAIQVWVSDALIKALGTQRVIPQPLKSVISNGGLLYTFPVASVPASVEFQSQPAVVGSTDLLLRVPGHAELKIRIFVMP